MTHPDPSEQSPDPVPQRLSETILRCAGEGIYCVDRDGVTTFVNPAAADMLGWTAADIIGVRSHDLFHHTKADGTPTQPSDCPVYAAFHDGVVHRVHDQVFWQKNGSSFPVELTSTPIFDDDDKPVGAVVTFSDITTRRAVQQEMAKLRRHNESILESAAEGIYGLDTEGRTTFVNPAASAILGWTPEELLGKPQHALIHHTKPDGSPYPRGDCPIYAAFTDGAVHRVDCEYFWRKDGTSVPVEYTSTPVRDDTGKLVGAVVTFNDITERRLKQKALETAHAEVEQLKERLHAENLYLQQEIKVSHNFEEIIGHSPSMTKAKRLIEQVAETDATVLVLGETGVGKELFARAIHSLSSRKNRPLVKVNCAALPSTLIESELFGHEKGAFTGATSQRAGRFELADGGTIFLDEIGELTLELQAKLLRVLQEGEFERLGSERTIKVDIRIVAATNRDLSKMVLTGDFRDDLYYRLNIFPVRVPSLRERREDIPQLVTHFVRKFAVKIGKRIDTIPEHVQIALNDYDWPGNIRELENIIERAVILSSSAVLRIDETLDARAPSQAEPTGTTGTDSPTDLRSLRQVERAHILGVLKQTSWRIAGNDGAAVILDMHPNTLRSRMSKLGLSRPTDKA